MVNIPLGKTDYRRAVANEPVIPVLNRYFEANPTALDTQTALLSRPGLHKMATIGDGPIRQVYSQPGSFEDCLFVVSDDKFYRYNVDGSIVLIGGGISGNTLKFTPSITATARINSVPEMLYLADGKVLWLYMEQGFASGVLTASSLILDGDTVQIGTVYYRFVTGSVDTGTPDGTSANPWLVLTTDNATTLDNLRLAVSNKGTPGSNYSTDLQSNPTIAGISASTTQARVQALDAGAPGNSLPVSVVTGGARLSWGAATLTGGGSPTFTQVQTPDDVGMVSVGFVAGYVICVCAADANVNGRFYWINPGDTFIDALNFATAERSPDPVYSVRVVGDQFWLLGSNSTEVWYPTGDATGIAPFQRVQGKLFDRGVWQGTDVQIKDSVLLIDSDGIVYQISGAGPVRISDSSIEERTRKAILASTNVIF